MYFGALVHLDDRVQQPAVIGRYTHTVDAKLERQTIGPIAQAHQRGLGAVEERLLKHEATQATQLGADHRMCAWWTDLRAAPSP